MGALTKLVRTASLDTVQEWASCVHFAVRGVALEHFDVFAATLVKSLRMSLNNGARVLLLLLLFGRL